MIDPPKKSRPWLGLAILFLEILAANWASLSSQAYVLSCLPAATLGLFSSRFASCNSVGDILYVLVISIVFIASAVHFTKRWPNWRGIAIGLLSVPVASVANFFLPNGPFGQLPTPLGPIGYGTITVGAILAFTIFKLARHKLRPLIIRLAITMCVISLLILALSYLYRINVPSFLWLP